MTEKTDEEAEVSQEEIIQALNQRDALVVLAVADGLKKRWDWMLGQISRGKQRNNKFNQGYLECLRDTHHALVDTVSKALPPSQTQDVSEEEAGKEEA